MAEYERVEREGVRRLRDHAEGCGGSVPRTLSWLAGEVGSEVECATASAASQDMMIRLCLAFDLDLAQARCATAWVGLGLGGQVSDVELEAIVGNRFVARPGDDVLSSSDVRIQARRQYRITTPVEGADGRPPLLVRRAFHVRSYAHEGRRVVLRSWDCKPGFGALEIEFGGVVEMQLPDAFRGGELSVAEERDETFDGPTSRLFVLADGTSQRSFVRCASVGVYRSEPDGGSGTGTEPPDPWTL
ncbi:hypothetical protein ACFY0G_12115 [Streptomyces sp. NPDC001552]|uniref:hypothetical protein n=1 Tax=Streptomyces sp. NPDC001552 TaxID=3364587 RepID=UPI00368EED50